MVVDQVQQQEHQQENQAVPEPFVHAMKKYQRQ
jgi:hypothetical protein